MENTVGKMIIFTCSCFPCLPDVLFFSPVEQAQKVVQIILFANVPAW